MLQELLHTTFICLKYEWHALQLQNKPYLLYILYLHNFKFIFHLQHFSVLAASYCSLHFFIRKKKSVPIRKFTLRLLVPINQIWKELQELIVSYLNQIIGMQSLTLTSAHFFVIYKDWTPAQVFNVERSIFVHLYNCLQISKEKHN